MVVDNLISGKQSGKPVKIRRGRATVRRSKPTSGHWGTPGKAWGSGESEPGYLSFAEHKH